VAYEAYLTIKGSKQGKFKGESNRSSAHDKIPLLSFSYEVRAPRDVASGQASGKRQHRVLTVVKEWGAASPQIFQALTSNEVLNSVVIEAMETAADGSEHVKGTFTLTNAVISRVNKHPFTGKGSSDTVEEVTFAYENISLNGASNVAISHTTMNHKTP